MNEDISATIYSPLFQKQSTWKQPSSVAVVCSRRTMGFAALQKLLRNRLMNKVRGSSQWFNLQIHRFNLDEASAGCLWPKSTDVYICNPKDWKSQSVFLGQTPEKNLKIFTIQESTVLLSWLVIGHWIYSVMKTYTEIWREILRMSRSREKKKKLIQETHLRSKTLAVQSMSL